MTYNDVELRTWATSTHWVTSPEAGVPHLRPGLEPFHEERLQPASIDLTLGNTWAFPHSATPIEGPVPIAFDRLHDGNRYTYTVLEDERYVLQPGIFILATTAETVAFGHCELGRVEGKSSLGRLGLAVHVTAGYIDPGFYGQVTLELVNFGPRALDLYAGDPICQLAVERLSAPVVKAYGAGRKSYTGQKGVKPPRGHYVQGTI